jgi:hypothetical protein
MIKFLCNIHIAYVWLYYKILTLDLIIKRKLKLKFIHGIKQNY